MTDAAYVLDPATTVRLTRQLGDLERAIGHQMVTLTTLDGIDVATSTRRLGNAWGIGRRGVSDGVIVLVAPRQRKVRIAVGYGLKATLPDALCRYILDADMQPRFLFGDCHGGIVAGVAAIVE